MAESLFGTDGVRGRFGDPPLDRETVTAIGSELGTVLRVASARPLAVLGGDTRASTPTLCEWLAEGLSSHQTEIRHLGVVPTPGIAWAVRHLDAEVGIAVSASHNPHPDNGIKLFDEGGRKWTSEAERRLEQRLAHRRRGRDRRSPRLGPDTATVEAYLEALGGTVPEDALEALHVAVDAAHGAASPYVERVFASVGAAVTVIHAEPDGTNINSGCGSTAPEELQRVVTGTRADLGIAFDGDADRALLVDDAGALVDGDAMLYLWAEALHRRGQLDPPLVVATSMSNLGLDRALGSHGIEVVRCGVGDRQVAATIQRLDAVLGGEQSGHLIHSALSTTGDGMLTGLQLATIVADRDRPLSELLADFERFPQILVNVEVGRKPPLDSLPGVARAVREVEERLGTEGRLLVRYSGTEPVARVMVEGRDREEIEELAATIAAEIRHAVGAEPASTG